jgi:hypothetical protein
MNDLLSSYQRELLDMLFMGDSDNRGKYVDGRERAWWGERGGGRERGTRGSEELQEGLSLCDAVLVWVLCAS